jgi:hypothetical protein
MQPNSWRPNWIVELVTRWVTAEKSSLSTSVRVAMILFLSYWVVPRILCGLEGTLFDPRDLQMLVQRLGTLFWLSSISTISPSVDLFDLRILYYSHDKTHFLFSLCLAALAFSGNVLFDKIEMFTAELRGAGSHIARENEVHIRAIYGRYRRLFRAPRWLSISPSRILIRIGAVVAGGTAFMFFYSMKHQFCSTPQCWWSQSGFGVAGSYYCAAIGIIVYFATEGLAAMLAGAAMINSILRNGHVKANLFAPDLANGLAPVGNFVLTSFISSLMGSVGIFIILWLGYFGVENLLEIWTLIIIATMFIPLATLVPLYSAMNIIYDAKQIALQRLNSIFQSQFMETRSTSSQDDWIKNMQPAIALYRKRPANHASHRLIVREKLAH